LKNMLKKQQKMSNGVKAKSKKSNDHNHDDIRQDIRGLGVLIERVNDNVSFVAEQYEDIKQDVSSIKQDVSSIKQDVSSIKQTVDSHTETLGHHTEMIGSMKTDMEIMKTDIEFIKTSLKRKVDVEEFAVLERRVAALERG